MAFSLLFISAPFQALLQGTNTCWQIANIRTGTGARTSLLVPQLNLFLVAESSFYPHGAELMVYKIQEYIS
jgi:hypothetical protein